MHHDTIHDKAYKYLFSNPMMLKELLESFVAMDWVDSVQGTAYRQKLRYR